MIIIGEKINGTIHRVKKAIEEKDIEFIQNRAIKQEKAGAHYIDVCAGTAPDKEIDTLKWLIEVVQEVVEIPLVIDSPNPNIIKAVIPFAKKPGLINSVSEEGNKPEIILPLAAEYGWDVIALTCNDNGIPSDVETRVEITTSLVKKANTYGINEERIYIDPLVTALAADNKSTLNFVEAMKEIRKKFPKIKFTSGLSNISFGMPLRKMVNRHFMTMALYEGMDSAIMDPLDKDMMGAILATEALLGKDRHCRKFSNAYRKGEIF